MTLVKLEFLLKTLMALIKEKKQGIMSLGKSSLKEIWLMV